MAKTKNKNILQLKTKIHKPSAKVSVIVNDMARIRNNEQAKLRRLDTKFSETRNKAEQKQIRSQLKVQADVVRKLKKTVVEARDYAKEDKRYTSELKTLRSKGTRFNTKLGKLYESQNHVEYEKLSKESVKNESLIKAQQDRHGKVLYRLNKKLGIKSEAIVKKVAMSEGFVKKNFSKDLGAEYFEKIKRKEPEKQEAKLLDEGDYVHEMANVFWQMWTDFDKTESKRLQNYDLVTFVMEGTSYSYKGSETSYIHMRASDMWRIARELGSTTYIVKYITVDGKKLKYVIE